jgi:hypothetical protein
MSGRPLLVTDCDEVILHMVSHFADWVAEAHDMSFDLSSAGLSRRAARARRPAGGADRVWPLLDGFFAGEMHRQNLVPGAAEALAEISDHADIVILTNIGDEYEAGRVEQLERFDIRHRVLCNRGGKGRPVLELIEAMGPKRDFVHRRSRRPPRIGRQPRPQVWRLHMIAEPRLAAHTPPAPHAHARIDTWDEAVPWILERLRGG